MKKWMKIVLGVIGVVALLFAIDLISIFTRNKPLFAIKEDNSEVYKGLLYDTYNCPEYSTPQIKVKGTKFSCATSKKDNKDNEIKVSKLVDKTKEIEGFTCAEALEEFYEDDKHTYFWSCMKDEYMVVRYEDSSEEPISNALKNKKITISDLDRFDISYYKEGK